MEAPDFVGWSSDRTLEQVAMPCSTWLAGSRIAYLIRAASRITRRFLSSSDQHPKKGKHLSFQCGERLDFQDELLDGSHRFSATMATAVSSRKRALLKSVNRLPKRHSSGRLP
jgi:hypothetical protein